MSNRIRITKEFKFETGHALYGYDGLCKNVHGHSYKLSVTVVGKPIEDQSHVKFGMVMDFSDLKAIVNTLIVKPFDHAAVMLSDHGLGLGVFLAILLHKPLDSLSIETVMANAGWASAQRWSAAILFAVLCPLTAIAFHLGMAPYLESSLWLPGILAFAGGAFICIALSDLLPEVQFHSHDRVRLTLLFLMGIALALAIGWFEPAH